MAKTKKKVESEKAVTVKFSIANETYTGTGDTILEALQEIKPRRYMGLCKVEATVNGRVSKIPITLVPTRMKRMFEKPVELALFAKRLQTLL